MRRIIKLILIIIINIAIITFIIFSIGRLNNNEKIEKNIDFSMIFNTDINEVISVEKDGKYGAFDRNGNEVFPCEYDDDIYMYEGIAVLQKNGQYAAVNKDRNYIIEFGEYDYIEHYYHASNMLLSVEKEGKKGLVSYTGELLIPIEYDEIDNFDNEIFKVEKDGIFAYIDKTGKLLEDFKVIEDNDISEGLTLEKLEQSLMEKYDLYSDIENGDGAKLTMLDNKFGIVNSNGEEIVECFYDDINDNILEGKDWIEVKKDKKYGIINSKGEIIVDLKYDNIETFQDGLAVVEKDGLCGYIDTTGTEVIECQYMIAQKFSEGLAYVSEIVDVTQKSYYIDKNNNKVLDISKYGFGLPFVEGNAVVFDSLGETAEYGLIDKTGKLIIGNFDN